MIPILQPSFNWHLTRERIAEKALEKLNEIGVGETPSSASWNLALEALDGTLKMLQFQGLQWPKLSRGQIDLVLYKDQDQAPLPADYYGFAEINYFNQQANGDGTFPAAPVNEVPLGIIASPYWHQIEQKRERAAFPRFGYIDNSNILWLWPIPNQNVACRIFYQRVIEDSRAGTSPHLRAPWALALPYGVALEMSEEFEIGPGKIERISTMWQYYLDICLKNEAGRAPLAVSVATGGRGVGGLSV